MSGGGGGGGDDGVQYQREQEEARQARIRDGMARIDELFNGKDVPATYAMRTGQKVTTDPYWGTAPGTYYDEAGKPYTFTGTNQWRRKGGILVGTPEYGDVYTPQNLYTSAEQYEATPAYHTGGFDDSVFNKRAQAYQDFAMPQVEQQYADQQKALTYALARGGNLQSSLASNKTAELDKDYGLQRQAVIDKGQDYVNQGKVDLANQKASAVSMLQATADPDAAYNVAAQSAQQLSTMPSFQPLDPVVKNVAAGLGTYLTNQQTADAIAKANAGGSYSLPANWSGSGKVGR
jgi:hypothetical protein